MKIAIAAVVFGILAVTAHADEVWFDGKVRWWDDGDTPVLHLRLKGIDAPEKKQLCEDAHGKCYPCSKHSTEAMKALGKGKLRYRVWEIDRYGRPGCCQTNANSSQYGNNLLVLCSTELLPFDKSSFALNLKCISRI